MTEIAKRIPLLAEASERELEAFEQFAVLKTFAAGEQLAFEGDSCPYFFVVLKGRMRVYKIGESGREITLYYVDPFESCVLTAFCILSQTPLPAYAVAEETLEMVVIPSGEFRKWIDRFPVWRDHTFNILSRRLGEIMTTIEKVAFLRVDERVAVFLIQALPPSRDVLAITHDKLARELGTTRVGVSRVLEEFEKNGWVSLSRGKIHIRDRHALQQKAKNTLLM